MEIEEKSPYDEWRKENPNGNLNEFYTYLKKSNTTILKPVSITEPMRNGYNSVEIISQNYTSIIIGCIACLIGLIGYFTPWFSLPILDITISGNEINQLSNILDNYLKHNESIKEVNFIKFSYLIPITYILICLSNIMKSYFLTILISLVNLVFVGMIIGFMIYNIPQALSIVSYGIYITILSWLITLYNIFTLKF